MSVSLSVVNALTATANQTALGGTVNDPILAIANNPVIPGIAGMTIPSGNTAARAGSAGTMRFNSQTSVFEGTTDGATWETFSTAAGVVLSVTASPPLTSSDGINPNIALTTPLALNYGGSNANLVASNGGIIWSNAVQMQILSGTATANQVLLSGSSSTPAWSTATYPPTTTINQLLYSSSANTIAGLATTNNAALTTTAGGVPTWLALTDGQIIVGSSAGAPAAATLTASTGISITNGHNSITISSNGGVPVVDQTSNSVTMAINTRYVTDNGAVLVTYTLPAVAALGSSFEIVGSSSGGWTVSQQAGQTIHFNSTNSTTGGGGSLSSINRYNCVKLICTIANTDFTVQSSSGTLAIV